MTRFHLTSFVPPIDATAVVNVSSSPDIENGRFCAVPVQFGNVEASTCTVYDFSASLTEYVLSSRSFFDGLFRAPFDGFVSATGDQFAGRMRFSGSLVLRKVKGGYLSKEMDWLRMPVRYSRKRRCPILDCRCARRRWFCAGRDGTMPDRTKDATSHFRFPHAVEASGSGSAN